MSKFKNAHFKFTIKPEDSGFLKAWKELREDPEFQEKLVQVKLKIESEEKTQNKLKEREKMKMVDNFINKV